VPNQQKFTVKNRSNPRPSLEFRVKSKFWHFFSTN